MARPRSSSTVTHGDLKFRPVPDRGTKEDGAGRVLRYWRCDRYKGREDGKPVREAYRALWAAESDLPEVAARYARGATERPLLDSRVTADDFRETATAGMVLQAWMTFRMTEEADSLSPRSLDINRRYIGATKELAFRKIRAAAVGKPALDALSRDLRTRWGTRTTKDILKTVAQAWRWAYERGHVPRPLDIRFQVGRLNDEARKDPVRSRVMPKYTPTIAQAQEVGRWMMERFAGTRSRWQAVAYLLTLAVGNRRGALPHISWSDLRPGPDDAAPGMVQLRKTKTGPRDVYVSTPVLRQILAMRPAGATDADRLLLTPEGGRWRAVSAKTIQSGVNVSIARACVELGIPHFSVQALRRLAAQERARWAVRNGGSLAAAAKQSGHTVQTFLAYYEQAREDEVKASAAATDYAMVPPVEEANVVPLRRSKAKG